MFKRDMEFNKYTSSKVEGKAIRAVQLVDTRGTYETIQDMLHNGHIGGSDIDVLFDVVFFLEDGTEYVENVFVGFEGVGYCGLDYMCTLEEFEKLELMK